MRTPLSFDNVFAVKPYPPKGYNFALFNGKITDTKATSPTAALTPHCLNSKVKCDLRRKFKTTVLPLKKKLPEIFFRGGFPI